MSLLKQASPLVAARLLGAAVTFAIPLYLARRMPLEAYGSYKQLFLVATTLYYLLNFGLGQSLYYFAPREPRHRPFAFHALVLLSGTGLLAAIALWAVAPSLGTLMENPALEECRVPLGLYVLGLLGGYPLEIHLTSVGKRGKAAVSYVASDALRTAALIGPVLLGLGLPGMMWAMAALSLARLVASWGVLLSGTQGRLWDGALLRRQLAYAAPFGGAVALAVVQQSTHQYAVAALFTPALFAIYAVGCFQLPVVDLLYAPVNEVLMVRLGELERTPERGAAAAQEAFREATSRLALAFFPLAAFLWITAPQFLALLFGPSFSGSVPIFRITVLGLVLAALPLDGVLRGRNQTRVLLRASVVRAVLSLSLVAPAIHFGGLLGAVLSFALAELGGLAVMLRAIPASLGASRLRELLPWGSLVGAALGSLTGAVVLWMWLPRLQAALPAGVGRLGLLAFAGVIFAVAFLVAVGGARSLGQPSRGVAYGNAE